MKNRILQDVIGEDDALGHVLPRRIEVIEVSRIENGGAVILRLLRIIHVAYALHESGASRRHRLLACALDDDVDDGLAIGDLRLLFQLALLRALGFPRLDARILHLRLGGSGVFSGGLRIHAPNLLGVRSGVLHLLVALDRAHDGDGRRGVRRKAGKTRSKCDGAGEDSRSLHIQVSNLLCLRVLSILTMNVSEVKRDTNAQRQIHQIIGIIRAARALQRA